MEEEDNIIVKWAQEDVETSYSLLNKNKNVLYFESKRKVRKNVLICDVCENSKLLVKRITGNRQNFRDYD